MSSDLRRGVAYFGPREKVYKRGTSCELPGLPLNWRRVLCTGYPFPVVGPMGCVYRTIDHAMAGFRVHYSTNNPCLAFLFRHENTRFARVHTCREWSSNNALSLLLTSPDDRVWFVIRDRCMYDLVFQRICRDAEYRGVLQFLIEQKYLPVYHVKTAHAHTYWGGIIDKTKLNLTTVSAEQNRAASLDLLAEVSVDMSSLDPASIIVGKNRLGFIMKSAMETYRQVYDCKMALRVDVFKLPTKQRLPSVEGSESDQDEGPEEDVSIAYLPAYELTPLATTDFRPPPSGSALNRKRKAPPSRPGTPPPSFPKRCASAPLPESDDFMGLIDSIVEVNTPPRKHACSSELREPLPDRPPVRRTLYGLDDII